MAGENRTGRLQKSSPTRSPSGHRRGGRAHAEPGRRLGPVRAGSHVRRVPAARQPAPDRRRACQRPAAGTFRRRARRRRAPDCPPASSRAAPCGNRRLSGSGPCSGSPTRSGCPPAANWGSWTSRTWSGPSSRRREAYARWPEFNAWHAAPSPDGRTMVADTVHPNVGLQLFPVRGGPARLTVCASGASSIEANPCCIEDRVVDSRTAPAVGTVTAAARRVARDRRYRPARLPRRMEGTTGATRAVRPTPSACRSSPLARAGARRQARRRRGRGLGPFDGCPPTPLCPQSWPLAQVARVGHRVPRRRTAGGGGPSLPASHERHVESVVFAAAGPAMQTLAPPTPETERTTAAERCACYSAPELVRLDEVRPAVYRVAWSLSSAARSARASRTRLCWRGFRMSKQPRKGAVRSSLASPKGTQQ